MEVVVAITVIYVIMLTEFIHRFRLDRPVTRQRDAFFWACCRTRREKASRQVSPSGSEKNLEMRDRTVVLERGEDGVESEIVDKRKVWIMLGAIIASTLLIIAR